MRISSSRIWCTVRYMSHDKLKLMGVPVDVAAEQPVEELIRVNNDRVLMSDTLKGNVPEIEGTELEEMAANYIMVVIERQLGADVTAVVGTLRSVMCDDESVELEVNTELDEALIFIRHSEQGGSDINMTVAGVELHPGEDDPIRFDRCYLVTGCRLMDIDYRRAMCTLLLQLKSSQA